MMRRRDFLRYALGTPWAVAACSSSETEESRAPTPDVGPWGEPPPGSEHLVLDASRRPEGTLEVFCLGGLSPWETFYTVREFGKAPPGSMYYTFQNDGGIQEWMERCAVGVGEDMVYWTDDANQVPVNLGPFTYPLRDRPDMLARMRVWVMRHHLEPHELAIPYAITGHTVGNPKMAAFASHLERFFRTREPTRSLPNSYVLYMSSFNPSNNAPGFTAAGLHPTWARPLGLQLGSGRLYDQLLRPGAGGSPDSLDALTAHYLQKLEARLTPAGGSPVRSGGFREFQVARNALARAEAIRARLPEQYLQGQPFDLCWEQAVVGGTVVPDETTAGLQMARDLMTGGQERARYVQVVDGGIITDRVGQGYDSHGEHVSQQGTNVSHMLKGLSEIVNRKGENDPNKLDLDKHFVLLNTEFGRAPTREYSPRNPNGGGTNHWPWGYIVIGFGGFLGPEQSGIVGGINEQGIATQSISPSEHRAAMMLANGIWPFTPESYAVGDVGGVEDEQEAAARLMREVLGVEG